MAGATHAGRPSHPALRQSQGASEDHHGGALVLNRGLRRRNGRENGRGVEMGVLEGGSNQEAGMGGIKVQDWKVRGGTRHTAQVTTSIVPVVNAMVILMVVLSICKYFKLL
jgi:hypothetical protein